MAEEHDFESEAEELRRAVNDLRARLIALARILPVEYVPVLSKSESNAPGWDLDEGGRDTIDITVSDVETELEVLWDRLKRARKA